MDSTWRPTARHIKHYPHFDQEIPLKELERIVNDPELVAKNAFFPFIRYKKQWTPFRDGPKPHKKKTRPIRFASRRDSAIFSRYRDLLSTKYELELERLGISSCPIAYRSIPVLEGRRGGKCNIHFASEAFKVIASLGNCVAIALDISAYFESIDHELLRRMWCRLLETEQLPPDHQAIFNRVTRYAVVDRDLVYERLGYFGKLPAGEKQKRGYLTKYDDMPKQLCSPKIFRQKIAGGLPEYPTIIKINTLDHGIPQGSPISDLLANIYLLDFDVAMNRYAQDRGGTYYRYSDDILLILPGSKSDGEAAQDFAIEQIKRHGNQLLIKPEKSMISVFFNRDGKVQSETTCIGGVKNGLEYLGFRFDGTKVFLRDSTLSGFYRKIARAARREARSLVARYPGKDFEFIDKEFNRSEFLEKFSKVPNFDSSVGKKRWTFWTYIRRSMKIFGPNNDSIMKQMRKHKLHIEQRIIKEIRQALVKASAAA